MKTVDKFLFDVEAEYQRARGKFPDNTGKMIPALMEEVGELSKGLLKLTEDGELDRGIMNDRLQNVYEEAVQVAAMAARIVVEGESAMGYPGMQCAHQGCIQPGVGGPCPLCYE